MDTLDRSTTLARIVTEHPAAARVFQRHGMDYCCHGHVTVAEACRGRIDPEVVFAELEEALGRTTDREPEDDPRTLSKLALIARIVERYHGPARRALRDIAPIAAKVAAVHGDRDQRLYQLQDTFAELADALLPHLDDEENQLFPLLMGDPGALEVRRELERMESEHVAVGTLLGQIRSVTSGFSTPDWGCSTYRRLMKELDALEADTLRHVHLENHILVPLASRAA
jgi:regulator of cell morphogenesis and NO signaling